MPLSRSSRSTTRASPKANSADSDEKRRSEQASTPRLGGSGTHNTSERNKIEPDHQKVSVISANLVASPKLDGDTDRMLEQSRNGGKLEDRSVTSSTQGWFDEQQGRTGPFSLGKTKQQSSASRAQSVSAYISSHVRERQASSRIVESLNQTAADIERAQREDFAQIGSWSG